ncbi:somatostatin receptor type 5-like [Crassostrea angulata]|uniref:somatostatin receptor type 5-like n=1 Tax=Magallana angulata TaxID=2784310 RepID=UPI0022B0E20B|nr:somatostatin receptor type 5-like [Crassostrea angulata]
MDDYVDISTQEGFENDLTSEGFTLKLRFSETSFEITFTCVIFTIASFGCIGNLVTIGKIVHDPKYHTPTFAAIGVLALADFVSVTTLTFDAMTNFWKFLPSFSVVGDIVQLSSYFHLCLLSAVRYLITVYPLQSRQYLTATAVCLCSLTIWIVTVVAILGLRYTSKTLPEKNVVAIYLTVNVFMLLIVCSIMALLHVKKIRTLQNSLSVTEQSQRRMNIVVTVIIIIFVLYQLSIIAINITIIFLYQQFSAELYYHRVNIEYYYVFTGCINFSCNPYILFLSQFL